MESGFRNDLLESYSDAELIQHIVFSPKSPGSYEVHLLSSEYIAKSSGYKEAEDAIKAMEVAHQLGIRSPRVTENGRQ